MAVREPMMATVVVAEVSTGAIVVANLLFVGMKRAIRKHPLKHDLMSLGVATQAIRVSAMPLLLS